MRALKAAVLLAALGAGAPALAAKCPDFQQTPRPDWVTRTAPPVGTYVGVGQAQKGLLNLTDQMAQAKQAALRELAGSIRVAVRSELNLRETAKGENGKLATRTEVESSTQTRIEQELADVQADETWMDAKSCTVWVHVSVAEAAVRLQRLREFMAAAEDAALVLTDRERALAQAESLLPQVDFSVSHGLTRDYFDTLIKRLKIVLANARGSFEINDKDFRQAQELLQQARLTRDVAEQARLALPARELLTRVSSSAPFSKAPDFWPEKSMQELAEFEAGVGNPCEARRLLADLQRRGAADYSARAATRVNELSCSPEQKELSALRRLTYGRSVALICVYKAGNKVQSWNRACADLTSLLTESGAAKVDASELTPAKAAAVAESCARGCSDAPGGGGLTIAFVASGELKSRANSENPMGRDWQFKGEINSYVLNAGKPEFADRYTGIGGWNPVSAEMAMDVIGIQAGRRFRERASAHYAAKE